MQQKSPFRYPGGKSRAVKILEKYFNDVNEFASPFIGGGSFEIYMAQKGKRVYGYDAFDLLVNCWQQLLTKPEECYNELDKYYKFFWEESKTHDVRKELYYRVKDDEIYKETDPVKKAMMFLMVNRCSFSGLGMLGGFISMWDVEFTKGIMDRVKNFSVPNLSVEKMSFEDSISINADKRLYLDPPYKVEAQLYGTKNNDLHMSFDHQKLADILHERDNWVMSYNNCEEIRDMYDGYTIIDEKWTYGLTKDRKGNDTPAKEILILSKDIQPK